MNTRDWILLDTETTGFVAPIYVVELAAQHMRGWERIGPPFKRLINHGTDIPPEAARVHGYTREILERDGDLPEEVYEDFAVYVSDHPLVAYNLNYDLDQVLVPEWVRLGIDPIGVEGFCALALAQRLLDPVPAGNCKLQTLRQYYRLPERGAHTALGDVDTVIDLMQGILQPLAEARGLISWDDLVSFCQIAWFPRRIPFGKHKGRDFQEAHVDKELLSWLEWLSESSNERSSAMGRWYLSQLLQPKTKNADSHRNHSLLVEADRLNDEPLASVSGQIAVFFDRDAERLQTLITAARQRLADLSSEFMTEKRAVDATAAALFNKLKNEYRRRDMLATLIQYRRCFLQILVEQGDEEAESVKSEYQQANERSEKEYEDAARSADETKDLSAEQEAEVKSIWKRLARLYHPDRVQSDPERKRVFEKLLSVVNDARAFGDIVLLQEIADNPEAYMEKQGWDSRGSSDDQTVSTLEAVYEAVSLAIIECIEETERLRETEQYYVMKFCRKHADGLDSIVAQQRAVLTAEIDELQVEADRLQLEIEELTGDTWGSELE